MTDKLKQDGLDFLKEVEDAAREEGRAEAKQAYDKALAEKQAEFDKAIVEAREEYYNMGFAEAGKEQAVEPIVMGYPDGTEYENNKVMTVTSFSYSRKFAKTTWGTIMLPVSLSYTDWNKNFEIAEIIGITAKGSGYEATRRILGSGDVTEPNKPYLIRAKKADSKNAQILTKRNCIMYPAAEGRVEIVSGSKRFAFVGSYKTMTAAQLSGKYYSSGGMFVKATGKLLPMRVYLEISKI